ncbi:hypothetical protein [Ulvibacterium sp.]|uniref:hypothetical protein n=1 Tax=Ulvibacterium sp. TaxID=2665914 RepID=UPI002624C79B|nr:hypothetical protein [Ulvibacterium sp.]
MKSYVILFVAMLMLVKPLWPIAEYVMNYDYIVNVLCKNKDKPQLRCDGKCYLSQQLAKEAEQNKSNPFGEEQNIAEIQHLVFFQSLKKMDLHLFLSQPLTVKSTFVEVLRSSIFTSDISQPPELA